MAEDITITYETLFELFRREKDRQELQKLWDSYIIDVSEFIRGQQKIVMSDPLTPEARKKVELHLDNIKRIIRELYERREKKIVSMALDRTRTRSDIFDTSIMLENERELFNKLVGVLNNGRHVSLVSMTSPSEKPPEQKPEPVEQKVTKMVRFLHPVPKFLGPNLEQYGPFSEEDMANLPAKVADILISKERAEEIEEQ
ncbi:MAG: hypothetical protein KJ601_04085 [Nanoarchaeota archaeon]|nr:hypothetical protein [Nanoarchaeota archaeon]